jgi:heterodisulfide reductase subunit A
VSAPEQVPQERIGVYVCHCGTNIAGTVDVEDVAQLGRGSG